MNAKQFINARAYLVNVLVIVYLNLEFVCYLDIVICDFKF
jgi:hypothetical protein